MAKTRHLMGRQAAIAQQDPATLREPPAQGGYQTPRQLEGRLVALSRCPIELGRTVESAPNR